MSTTPFLPFCRPSITDAECAAVEQVMRSGWLTTGAKNNEFEQLFAEYTGAAGAVSVASATGGMQIVLKELGVGPGDEVITPSMTWVSTVNLIVLAGATPVFVDVDRDTLLVSAEAIEAALSERTKAIIPVHFAGAPVDLGPIRQNASDHDIALIEDAAHAVGAEYRGERIGKCGVAIFSFHPIKNMTTGEGGMITSDDTEYLERLRRLRFHGLGVDAYDRQTQGRSPQAEVVEPGFKYNMTDMAAALGIVQLSRLDELNARRAELDAQYRELLADVDEVQPLVFPNYPHEHAHHLFIVRVLAGLGRDNFMAALKERGIGTGIHFRAVHQQRFYRETYAQPGSLPNTEWNSDRICSLPFFPDMTEDDVIRVVDTIKEVVT